MIRPNTCKRNWLQERVAADLMDARRVDTLRDTATPWRPARIAPAEVASVDAGFFNLPLSWFSGRRGAAWWQRDLITLYLNFNVVFELRFRPDPAASRVRPRRGRGGDEQADA